ncbi:MAG TPA: alcohol dehydrogenase catalytic domain-containing protein, partial [Acidimicrobiales bacterium]
MLTELDGPLEVWDDMELDAPGPGEVTVRMAASGVCHSDLSMQDGTLPVPLPAVLGHEGAGIVEQIGDGVADLVAGDHVVVSWVPQCGQCYFCLRGQPELCTEADTVLITGGLLDGTPRLRARGQPVHQMCGCATFSEKSVVAAIAAVKVPDELDLAKAALLACGVLT